MSARPDVPRLSEEDLDLLISRSLDGDLSPEEEQQLERIVALDAAAARRKEELAALVAQMNELPEPAAPFAIATRVTSNVAERAGRPGSLAGRVGFFPAPGYGKVAIVVLFLVGVSIAILRPSPKPLAQGPVDVLLYSPSSPAPAEPAARAPDSVVAQAGTETKRQREADRPSTDNARAAVLADKLAKTQKSEEAATKERGKNELAAGAAGLKKDASHANAAAEPAPALVAEAAPKAKQQERGAGARSDLDESAAVAQAPAKVTGGLAAAPAAPPAAASRALAARAESSAVPGGWTVSVRGDAARRWSLRRAPDRPPSSSAARPAVFRVVVDASGGVTSATPVGSSAPAPGLDAFVRGMIFEPLSVSGSPRDAKDGETQPSNAPASAPAEFEIELTPR